MHNIVSNLPIIIDDNNLSIEIYNFQKDSKKIKTYDVPVQAATKYNFLNTVIDWTRQQVFNQKFVQVRLAGKTKPDILYVKLQDLNGIIDSSVEHKEDVTETIIKYNTRQLIKKIENSAKELGVLPELSTRYKLQAVTSKVAYYNLEKMLNNSLSSDKLFYTLVAVGKAIKNNSLSIVQGETTKTYAFEINAQGIHIEYNNQRYSLPLGLKSHPNNKSQQENESITLTQSESDINELDATTKVLNKVLNKGNEELDATTNVKESKELDATTNVKESKELDATTNVKESKELDATTNVKESKELDATTEIKESKELDKEKTPLKSVSQDINKTTASVIARPIKVVFNENLQNKKKQKITTNHFKVERDLLNSFNQSLDHNFISQLKDKVGEQNLLIILERVENLDDKKRMLNTLNEIGKQLGSLSQENSVIYVKKQLAQTFPFAIQGEKIFITTKTIASGSFKEISDTFLLEQKSEFIRLKIKKNLKKNKSNYDKNLQELNEEQENLKKLHNQPDGLGRQIYIADPYESSQVIKDENGQITQFIAYQRKYQGDGQELLGAPIHHVLNFFKGAAFGLSWIHSQKSIHGDFKLANVLFEGDLNSSTPIIPKISDLGSITLKGKKLNGGTLSSLPPESVDCRMNLAIKGYMQINGAAKAKSSVDSFGLGVAMFECLTGSSFPLKISANDAKIRSASSENFDFLACGLNKEEMRLVLLQVENHIKSSHSIFRKQEKEIKLAMLDVCRKLLAIDPKERLGCLKAGKELEEIQKRFYPNHRP